MEESENRKLRLKAMRMEAAEAEASPIVDTATGSSHLSNPLADGNQPAQETSPIARFNFYTDPVANYSGNRRKSQKTNENSSNYFSPPTSSASPGPGNFSMTPPPSHQCKQSHSSDQRMSPLPYQTSGSWRTPSIPVQHLETPPAVWNRPGSTAGYGFPPNSPMVGGFRPNSPMIGGFTSPGFVRGGIPRPSPESGSGYQYNHTPNNSFGQAGSPNPNVGRSTRPQFNNSPSPGFGWGGSPSPNTGRGSGHQFSSSPRHSSGSGRGRGRGRGFHGPVSAQERPELFYHQSMLEDPWRLLIPVVRKLTVAEERSWLPKSISEKKDTVSGAGSGRRSGSNFAAALAASYDVAAALAASYEEAVATNDGDDV